MRNVFERLAVGADQAVVDRHDLQLIGGGLGDDAGTELDVRRADDEALGALRAEIVDGGLHLFAVFRADLDEREALLLGRNVGKLPLVLEPWLLRLLDDEAYLDVGRKAGCGGNDRARARQYCSLEKAHVSLPLK